MKKSSKPQKSNEPGKYSALIQQFKNLETQWRSLQNSRRPRKNHPTTLSTDDTTDNNGSTLTYLDRIVSQNSPRELMSRLQQRVKTPSTTDCDVEEILRDRRAAIKSGKLKGRRLFHGSAEEDDESECGEISSSDGRLNTDDRERRRAETIISEEVDMLSSFSFSDDSASEEKVVVVVEEEVRRGGDGNSRGGGGYVVAMAWFAFVLILVTIGLISMSCNGKFVEENGFNLVPT